MDSLMSREAGFMRIKILALGLTMAAALGATNCSNDEQKVTAAPPAPAAPVEPVKTASLPAPTSPRPTTLEILTVLSVENSVELLAQVDGIVTQIAYDQDSWVKKGAVLASLDDREIQAKLDTLATIRKLPITISNTRKRKPRPRTPPTGGSRNCSNMD